jgi:hypothetical protein
LRIKSAWAVLVRIVPAGTAYPPAGNSRQAAMSREIKTCPGLGPHLTIGAPGTRRARPVFLVTPDGPFLPVLMPGDLRADLSCLPINRERHRKRNTLRTAGTMRS